MAVLINAIFFHVAFGVQSDSSIDRLRFRFLVVCCNVERVGQTDTPLKLLTLPMDIHPIVFLALVAFLIWLNPGAIHGLQPFDRADRGLL